MAYLFGDADIDYLVSDVGVAALADVDRYALTPKSMLADIGAIRSAHSDHFAALVETVTLRRRARVKLTDAERWLLTDDAVQQATPSRVADRRAGRLAGRAVHDVTCSIGTELASLTGVGNETVIGSDLDPTRLRMAAHNVPGAALLRADALTPTTRGTVILADPGRRSGGRRTLDPAALEPPLPALLDAYPGRDLVVKCAPGLDFDRLDFTGEIEVTSLDSGVREACLWSPGLTRSDVRRRASVLSSTGASYEITDAEPDDIEVKAPGAWIVDPDGAVVRAGLVRHYAARHGLWQLDPRIAYLTGDSVPDGINGFRILERIKYSEKTLRQALTAHGCGAVEILVRGVDVDPALLRPKLKLRGETALSVIITRIERAGVAFICEARRPGAPVRTRR
ncbi:class I SAM-dependent methyltransferase [Rhodococcus sp. PAMC28707]|uniref:THUMP-like domain-containing protein n=1 Tax=unclassified Rhodococcus (in: high G+C Gram-positive bacteria) TaxID=192944 RepID=UPI00109DAE02|nr:MULTISPECIES: class I SAM-dependent methyltransferase [unclassified Rhodococcus (in: high G+C Gram-positive bacteria)]QCB50762.1 class I SAM-dependent methyltransferase [Rhodococcus sp. PAMC28705]QCB57546.1 class I SAM-dependent methyltransferase [Rhodococcus sp. PAMC28707]